MIFRHLSRFLGSIQKTVIMIINLKSLFFLHRRSSEDNTIDTARRCKAYCVRTVLHGLHIQGGFWQQRMKKDELCRCFSSVFLILICQWLGSRENLQEPSANHGFPHEIWKVPVHFPYSTSPMNVEVSISGQFVCSPSGRNLRSAPGRVSSKWDSLCSLAPGLAFGWSAGLWDNPKKWMIMDGWYIIDSIKMVDNGLGIIINMRNHFPYFSPYFSYQHGLFVGTSILQLPQGRWRLGGWNERGDQISAWGNELLEAPVSCPSWGPRRA